MAEKLSRISVLDAERGTLPIMAHTDVLPVSMKGLLVNVGGIVFYTVNYQSFTGTACFGVNSKNFPHLLSPNNGPLTRDSLTRNAQLKTINRVRIRVKDKAGWGT